MDNLSIASKIAKLALLIFCLHPRQLLSMPEHISPNLCLFPKTDEGGQRGEMCATHFISLSAGKSRNDVLNFPSGGKGNISIGYEREHRCYDTRRRMIESDVSWHQLLEMTHA